MHTLTKWIGLGALLIATSVLAQPSGEAPEAELGFRKGSQLTPQEQLTQSDAYLAKMHSTVQETNKLAEQARKEKDIIKLNCVNDKVTQIKGNVTLGEQTREALQVASSRSDEGARNHEFAKLTITYQKVVVLGQEAEACIGEEISYVGATRVDIDLDRDIPQDDPTVTPPSPLPVVRPPIASPFL
jgi:hypothetical protein